MNNKTSTNPRKRFIRAHTWIAMTLFFYVTLHSWLKSSTQTHSHNQLWWVTSAHLFRQIMQQQKCALKVIQTCSRKKWQYSTSSQPVHTTSEHLTIDSLFIEGQNHNKLFIITSGIHGPEGFAGSTLQDIYFQSLLTSEKIPETDILLIHSLNPYGYKYFQRTNPSNIDLNRNHANTQEFFSTNQAFETMSAIYTPKYSATTGLVAKVGFYCAAILKYITHGKRIILNSLSGQYQNEKSIFYGGHQLSEESQIAQKIIETYLVNKTSVVHIDLHTGFGTKNKLHFYGSDEFTSPDQLKLVQNIFPDISIDTGKDKDFYPTSGDFVDWTWKNHPQLKVIPMVFEFGTLDSQTLSGGLASLWTSVLENQLRFYGAASPHDKEIVKKRYEMLFNPQDINWQKAVIEQGFSALRKAEKQFRDL